MRFLNTIIFLAWFVGCASTTHPPLSIAPSALVAPTQKLIEIDHQYFKIGYDPDLRLARYVIYQVTAEQLKSKKATRRNRFKADPYLVEKGISHVKPTEYAGSPYHRGHLAPAADFAWSQEASDLSFVMSNMAPQKRNLNSDAWLKLENQVRRWACGEGKLTVITGPILSDDMPQLQSGLKIPHRFFKIVIDETPPRKILSFIYNQQDRGDVLKQRITLINKIENDLPDIKWNKLIKMFTSLRRTPASVEEWNEAECKTSN